MDGSVKGWQEDFLTEIGLAGLCKDDFSRIGGVDGVVSAVPYNPIGLAHPRLRRTAST